MHILKRWSDGDAEREGLPTLTLAFNGKPLSDDVLDDFAFEVHARYRQRKTSDTVTRRREREKA